MKVSELKKALAPAVKGSLKAIPMPYEAQGKTYNMPSKSWARDVKSDEKARRLLLSHYENTSNPHSTQITQDLSAFVDRVNDLIQQNYPGCDIRLELNELGGFAVTTDERLNILHGEVQS
jgi:hypothetical protein